MSVIVVREGAHRTCGTNTLRKLFNMASEDEIEEVLVEVIDWQKLRWRVVDWELIPPDMRERVVTFLTVPENICLNNAMTSHKVMMSNEEGEEDVRDQLIKSYEGAKIPAFDTYRFTDKGDFEGLRWVKTAGIQLQGVVIVLTEQEGGVVEDADEVLRCLMDDGREELAALHATKSRAKDTIRYDHEWDEEISTLADRLHEFAMAVDLAYANSRRRGTRGTPRRGSRRQTPASSRSACE